MKKNGVQETWDALIQLSFKNASMYIHHRKDRRKRSASRELCKYEMPDNWDNNF